MRKDRLYLFTFIAITLVFIIIASIAVEYFVKTSTNQLIETQLESSKREAKEIASLINYQLQNNTEKDEIIYNLQNSIQNAELESGFAGLETGFVSMFDWSGVEICHPDKTKRGQKIEAPSFSNVNNEISLEDVYNLLRKNRTSDEYSEIIGIYPVPNADWIVGAHINITKISVLIKKLRNRFYIIFVIMGFILVLSSVITVRVIGSFYEKKLEVENKKLEDEVINLAKLNKAIDEYQQKANQEKKEVEEKNEVTVSENKKTNERGKKRILTYLRHEILPVATDDIAYVYTENTITYVVDIRGKRSTINSSLDELQSNLDNQHFYRANRQFIISIAAIEKIIRYGNNQLKILMVADSEIDIIIGKNKASEFKQWLNL